MIASSYPFLSVRDKRLERLESLGSWPGLDSINFNQSTRQLGLGLDGPAAAAYCHFQPTKLCTEPKSFCFRVLLWCILIFSQFFNIFYFSLHGRILRASAKLLPPFQCS